MARILVVEDEADIADFVRRGLTEAGHAVDLATDGADALDCAAATPFDLVVLDVMLPRMDGLAVCRTLRERGATVPVLMLTARDAVADRVRGLDAGADDYLVKPFAFRELAARVRALLRRPAAGGAPTLNVGDLCLDPRERSCARAGTPVDLTAKEYAILELLARHPGQVFSRDAIAERVWDYAFVPGSNVIDVHVRNLRRKVDAPFGVPLIETVRGAGYRLAPPRSGG